MAAAAAAVVVVVVVVVVVGCSMCALAASLSLSTPPRASPPCNACLFLFPARCGTDGWGGEEGGGEEGGGAAA